VKNPTISSQITRQLIESEYDLRDYNMMLYQIIMERLKRRLSGNKTLSPTRIPAVKKYNKFNWA